MSRAESREGVCSIATSTENKEEEGYGTLVRKWRFGEENTVIPYGSTCADLIELKGICIIEAQSRAHVWAYYDCHFIRFVGYCADFE